MFQKFLLAAVLVLGFAGNVRAQNILHDHTQTFVQARSGIFVNHLELNQGQPLNSRLMTGFLGDGNRLYTYEGYYTEGLVTQNNPRPGWVNTDFLLGFWAEETRMIADPLLQNPNGQERSFLFDTPSNPGWDTPVMLIEGIPVYYFVFDLTPLQIDTIPGQRHYISVSGEGVITTDLFRTGELTSLGGPGALGFEPAWARLSTGTVLPLPSNRWVADRVTSIPSPSGVALLLLGCGSLAGRRRT